MPNTRPPNAPEVAVRALVLRQIVVYAFMAPPRDALEQWKSSWPAEELAQFRKDVIATRDEYWGRAPELRGYMSPRERELASSTIEDMSAQLQIDAVWRMEALQVLMWALNYVPGLPRYDVEADSDLIKDFPPGGYQDYPSRAILRPWDQIEAARDMAELWHWRSRTRELIEDGDRLPDDPEMRRAGFRTYDDILRFTARQAHSEGRLQTIDQDFAAHGKAYRDLTDDEWSQVRSITMERHFALNWLCGYAPGNAWDETPTDT